MLGGSTGGRSAAGGDVLGGFLGQARDAMQRNPGLASGGIGALAGALLGGRGSMGGAMGGAALGVLGMVVMNALRGAQGGAQAADPAPSAGPAAAPAVEEDQEAEAGLMLQAMIDAAKADGQIDQGELDAIMSKLDEAGIGDEGRRWVLDQLRRPPEMTPLLAVAGDAELAAKVYAASLLAIKVDTVAERGYLEKLAKGCAWSERVAILHEQLGVEDTPPAETTAPLRSPSAHVAQETCIAAEQALGGERAVTCRGAGLEVALDLGPVTDMEPCQPGPQSMPREAGHSVHGPKSTTCSLPPGRGT